MNKSPLALTAIGTLLLLADLLCADSELAKKCANAVVQAKSGQFTSRYDTDDDLPPLTVRTLWQVDALRTAIVDGDNVLVLTLLRKGKPGIEINRQRKTYERLKPARSLQPLRTLKALAAVDSKAVEDLGTKQIGKVRARGFRVALSHVGPNTGRSGTLSVWVDEADLPVLVVEKDQLNTKHQQDFRWNVDHDRALFNVQPPDDYEDTTPGPIDDKKLAQIIGAFRTYERAFGHYPKVDKILGDVTSAELKTKLGIPKGKGLQRFGRAVVENKNFPAWLDATWGFGWLNTIQHQNDDYGYFGKTVGPKDAKRVLVHWHQEDGYRVVYGDLKTELLAADQLRELLKQE